MRTGQAATSAVARTRGAATLAEAARLMRRHHVGSIVVMDDTDPTKPVGILTDRGGWIDDIVASIGTERAIEAASRP